MLIFFKNTPEIDFWSAVESGQKTQTVRKRGCRVGAAITMCHGRRNKKATCTGCDPVKIEVAPYGHVISVGGALLDRDAVFEFAAAGGFASPEQMFDYYGDNFEGHVIRWEAVAQ